MVQDPYLLPDPAVTANIYCAGRLDDLLRTCIAPLWQDIQQREGGRGAHGWVLRYRRRGEHLKVRFHAPDERAAAVREALERAVRAYFDGLEPGPARAGEAAENKHSLPIDPEDEGGVPQPDRSLLWTAYRRSPVTFGPELYFRDDRFAAIFTRALGWGTERALALFSAGDGADVPFRARQSELMKIVVSGLAGVDWSVAERAAYLVYHRNWLLRYLLVRADRGRERADEVLARFSANAARMGRSVSAIERTLADQWGAGDASGATGLKAALRDLAGHTDRHREHPVREIDPFALRHAYPAVFKVLHATANPLGIQPLDEAFVAHLLLTCYAPDEDGGFAIHPPAGS